MAEGLRAGNGTSPRIACDGGSGLLSKTRMAGAIQRFLGKLTLLAVSSLVCLVLLELVVRWLFPFYNPRGPHQIVFRFNAEGVPLGPPNQTIRQRSTQGDYDLPVTFNRHGFRDAKDFTTAHGEDWFAVGDSFGLGWGVPETNRFSNVLEQLAGQPVFNICIPTDIAGYRQLTEHVRRLGGPVSNLVVSICMENDLRDYYASKAPAGPTTKMPWKERARAWVKSHSAVYLLLATELQQSETLHRFWVKIGVARAQDSPWQMNFNPYNEEAITYAVDLLAQLRAGHARVVVLIIPARGLWIGKNRDAEARVHARFVELARQRLGVPIIDMKPILEAGGDPMQFYFDHDGHWNVTGHRLAGEQLAAAISAPPQ